MIIPTFEVRSRGCHSDNTVREDAGDFKVWVGEDSNAQLEGAFSLKN